jgi:hypothetical protein
VPVRFGVVDLLAHGHTPGSMSAHWPTSSLPRQPLTRASWVVLMTMPDGLPVAGVVVCYNGPIKKRERDRASPDASHGGTLREISLNQRPQRIGCVALQSGECGGAEPGECVNCC